MALFQKDPSRRDIDFNTVARFFQAWVSIAKPATAGGGVEDEEHKRGPRHGAEGQPAKRAYRAYCEAATIAIP